MMQIHYAGALAGRGYPGTNYPHMCYDTLWNPEVIEQATDAQKKLLGARTRRS
jgi:hypothetical protein